MIHQQRIALVRIGMTGKESRENALDVFVESDGQSTFPWRTTTCFTHGDATKSEIWESASTI